MSVPITLKPGGVEVGAAQQLFRVNSPVGIVGVVSPYDVTTDGQRFIASLNYAIAIKSPQRVASATSGLPVDGRSVGGNGFTGEGARGDGGPHCSIHPLRQDSCKEGHSDTYISRTQFPRDLESLAPLPKRRAWQF